MAVAKIKVNAGGFGCPVDVREYIDLLEREGELRRVKTEVDWKHEAGAMSRLVCERRGPAPLFEKVKDYPGQQLAAVLLGPSKPSLHARTALALGLPKDTPVLELIETVRQRLKAPIAPRQVSREQAPCKEVIVPEREFNLLNFPVPWIKEIDGGRYIGTNDIIVTQDPDTGWTNWATYRCMVKDEKRFSILLQPSRQHGGAVLNKYEAMNRPMPIALVISADPVSHLAATTPMNHLVSEADGTGGLRGEAVQIVKCETNDLAVPATAEIVIEGLVLPNERVEEGPFGEFTGHSAHRGKTPVVQVTAITHRRNPIFTMANMGKPWDDYASCAYVMTPAVAKNRLEADGVQIKSAYCYVPGVIVISLKPSPGIQKRVVSTLLSGQRLLSPGLVLVDEDVDVTNVEDVWWAICSRMNPENYELIRNSPTSMLNAWLTPAEREARQAGSWVMDATFPHTWSKQYREDHTKVSDFSHGWSESTQQQILARWKDYGYGDI
ncbi:MAG: UbiD family decarboxylase [Candidatus Binataceae bacterium]|nr:UbiD family decarboxylase [Candidatus Binataceae bacterium]